jgi:hypothetical protein
MKPQVLACGLFAKHHHRSRVLASMYAHHKGLKKLHVGKGTAHKKLTKMEMHEMGEVGRPRRLTPLKIAL